MDTYPITARSLGLYFKVDGNNLERAYKDHLSGFRNWEQASHAEDWVLQKSMRFRGFIAGKLLIKHQLDSLSVFAD